MMMYMVKMVKCKECMFYKHRCRLKDGKPIEIKDKWICCFGSLALHTKPDDSCCFGKEKANG